MTLSPWAQYWILAATVWKIHPLNKQKRTDAFMHGVELIVAEAGNQPPVPRKLPPPPPPPAMIQR